jgi:hypothetical protein
MGAVFHLEHANIMAFVTSTSHGAPRLQRRALSDFLDALAHNSGSYLIAEPHFEPWPEQIAKVAARAASELRELPRDAENSTLPGAVVERLLQDLRSELSDFAVFALAVGTG